MNTPPDLDEALIVAALREGWDFDAERVEYTALGFGSHHWVATDARGQRRFVTVDDLSRNRGVDFTAAFETARRLADAGFEFVLAPTRTSDGRIDRLLTERFSMAVFPYVDGETAPFGEHRSAADRDVVRVLVARLDEATDVVRDVARTDDLVLPHLDSLDPNLRWEPAGPFAQPALDLFSEIRTPLQRALDTYHRLADEVRESCEWVITHGEPHGGNVLWTADGPLVIDWDTTALGPPGRDWWMLHDESPDEAPDVQLYRLWWELAEVGCYVELFRDEHTDGADTRQSWQGLQQYAAMLVARA